jgi:hypothetical protein
VVADALDDRVDAAVADAEPLADDAAEVHLALDRAVADRVAGDDVLVGLEALGQRVRCGNTAMRPPDRPLPT